MSLDRIQKALNKVRSHQKVWVKGGYEALANQFKEEFSMNIVSVKYRFLRLNSTTLALVELHPNSSIPEVCQELYFRPPYLTEERMLTMRRVFNTQQIKEWKEECEYGFNVAVREAKFYDVIDYYKTEKNREVLLWNLLDPLTYWEEFVPLFDNDYNFILRN